MSKITILCVVCGMPKTVSFYYAKRQYCSDSCSRIGRRGTKLNVRSSEERFWEKVDKRGPNECWPWVGGKNSDGYGSFHPDHRISEGAHRFSYRLHKGEIPAGMLICHSCDNPPCVNPDHLWLGNDAQNVADKMAKGRHRAWAGENHPCVKLSELDVVSIRSDQRSSRVIAMALGISKSQVLRIKNGESWSHV